jgi:SulP family sulfate permease
MFAWQKHLPFGWLASYDASRDLWGDATAGLTVAVLLVPQAMAYAMLAGLPPIVGLYASILPMLGYAAFGTSRQLSVGPVAMDSLLVATGAALVAETGSTSFAAAAVLLAGMVGTLQLLMGIFHLGFLVNFLSHPIISGFTSAAAIVIGLSQLKHLLGIPLERHATLDALLGDVVPKVGQVHPLTFAIGAVSIGVIFAMRKFAPRAPSSLVAIVLATLVAWALAGHATGLQVVGYVPSGLPSLTWTDVSFDTVDALAPTAVMIALVGFMEAISVAKSFASKHRYEVDANRELVGLGAANIAAFFSAGYPVTGGFSRSAVNERAGARTPLASLITASLVALTLLFFTPLFHHLPNAALAAIVIAAVASLIDFKEPLRLWRVRRSDSVLLLLTFAVTLFVGIGQGIVVGVVASLMAFIQRSTRPHTAELGRLPGTDIFRNLENFPEAEPIAGVLILRMDAAFYFANVTYFRDRLESFLRNAPTGVHTVLLDASSMNDLDSSAERALRETVLKLREAGKDMVFANIKGPIRNVMKRSGLWQTIGDDHIYLDLPLAVRGIESLRARPRQTDGEDPDNGGASQPSRPASSTAATASARASAV